MEENRPVVSIALCTYKRPALLRKCLESLFEQTIDQRYEIVVVDNDKEHSARETVDSLKEQAARHGIPLTYDMQPEQNIALTRNKSVALCSGDYIAFIDDDEYAAPDWLSTLLGSLRTYNADAIVGPALPVFPEGFPRWLQQSPIYNPDTPSPTGTRVRRGGAGNALVKKAVLQKRPEPFDPAFGKTGGEDFELFSWLTQHGYVLCRCNEAIVYELQELNRASLLWHVRRGYRTGWQRSRVMQREENSHKWIVRNFMRLFSTPWNFLHTVIKNRSNVRGGFFFAARKAAIDFGKVGYWLGVKIEEYKPRKRPNAP